MSIRDQILAKNDQEQKLTETGYRLVTKIKDILTVRSFNFFFGILEEFHSNSF